MHIEQTLRQLRSMRLSHMATSLEERLSSPEYNDMSHGDFISLLVEDEYRSRQNRTLARAVGRAGFKPGGACVENLRYNPSRGLQKQDIHPFLERAWVEQSHNLIITGATGTGKTYLAEAIGLKACINGLNVRKVRYRRLFEEIESARGTGTWSKYLMKILKLDVLILDDFGMGDIDNRQTADLMDILEDRDQSGSIVITSQYPTDQWHNLFPDATMSDAICDRLIHTSHKIDLKGDTLRRRK